MSAVPVLPRPRALTREQATELVGAEVPALEPTLTTEALITDADSGEPVVAYLRFGDVAALRRAVLGFADWNTTHRASGMWNTSRTFGFSPRRPIFGREGCAPSHLTVGHPEFHEELVRWADRLADRFRDVAPEQAAAAADATAAVLPDWRLGDTHWTSGVINRTSTLPYHRDSANFKAWSAMPVLRRGVSGGYLTIPEYDLVLPCRDGWAVLFPGYELVHGVTPMTVDQPGGYRFSVVFYALRGLKDCFTVAKEAAYARERRTQREQAIVERLAAGAPPDIRDYREQGSITRAQAAPTTS